MADEGNWSSHRDSSESRSPADARAGPDAGHRGRDAEDPQGRDGGPASESSQRRPPALQSTRSAVEPSRGALVSPDASSSAVKRPTFTRRASSTRAQPHRGQEFSVDDAEEEVEEQASQTKAKHATGALRRAPSTVRRRPVEPTRLPTVESSHSDEAADEAPKVAPNGPREPRNSSEEDATLQSDSDGRTDDGLDEDDSLSDTESFTLKDRQEAINETHPFGIRIWKPALYKKNRSVEKGAEGDIHSIPGAMVSPWLQIFNVLWTLFFGWWLALVAATGCLLCLLFNFTADCKGYVTVLWGLAGYIFFPFGKYVKLIQEEAYAEEDEGEGRSITEYEQWQSGALEEGRLFFGPVRSLIGRSRDEEDSEEGESEPLLGRGGRGRNEDGQAQNAKLRFFGRGKWGPCRVVFFLFFYGVLTPLLFLVSGICWLLVFSVPMARVIFILFDHLRRHPLALEFHSDTIDTRGPGVAPSSILLCTYHAVGMRYWKYTVQGTNIFLINLLGVVAFVIFDYFVLYVALDIHNALTNNVFVFLLAIFSIVPLAYFIGQAVASISAQSTMGVGAAINAFFATVVEVFLYCIALKDGKAPLVEGSIIGSIFAGILLLPGLSMCFGAFYRKTQRFNVKSAGVTTAMLLFATIGAFGPTLFYQIYGSHEINCMDCVDEDGNPLDRDCRRCFFAQIPAIRDPFYKSAVLPYIWFSAFLLFLSYIIGLLFTLRTHAATIWNTELDEKKAERPDQAMARPYDANKVAGVDFEANALARTNTTGTIGRGDVRDSQLYKRILGQSLKQIGIPSDSDRKKPSSTPPSLFPSESYQASFDGEQEYADENLPLQGLTREDSRKIVRQMAEVAATAATVAARDAATARDMLPRKASAPGRPSAAHHPSTAGVRLEQSTDELPAGPSEGASGGHDAPNWGRTKSYVILFSATVAYAVIAEILVDTVDSVLENTDIDQKFLGITLFALVPNTTEFLNAISFAINGNIALSMEIGSAYALQVCLLQIPALVFFSVFSQRIAGVDAQSVVSHTFTLIFPQWDMVTVILCVFLLSYMYGEGKSNYFKGSILILSYLVVLVGFYVAGYSNVDVLDPNDPAMSPGRVTKMTGRRGAIIAAMERGL